MASFFPTHVQADTQSRWVFQQAARDPTLLFALLAISFAERGARLGELKNGSRLTTYTEADLENRVVPDFVPYKVHAVRLANESMRSVDQAVLVSTTSALTCLLSIEVCGPARTVVPVTLTRPRSSPETRGRCSRSSMGSRK